MICVESGGGGKWRTFTLITDLYPLRFSKENCEKKDTPMPSYHSQLDQGKDSGW